MGIPPATAVVVDDNDLAFAAAVFQSTSSAALAVEQPRRSQPLEENCTTHALSELIELGILAGHRTVLLSGTGG